METDLYSFCPCGSGKKLKWCCQHIHKDIERAYDQLQQGQQDTALRIVEGVVSAHPTNPEAWGRKAHLLIVTEQREQGEAALEKALELNPAYPYGLLLKAQLRAEEGEYTGALLLARKAAEAYHAEAHDHLASVYSLIYELEVGRNRPVAAHAALRILIRCAPGEEEFRNVAESQYGPESALPASARKDYAFQSPSGDMNPERRRAWDAALGQTELGHLGKLAAAFEQLTAQDPADAAAWFNLALAQAWLGENRKSLATLDRYLELEQDDARAADAAALAEVLRCGLGLEQEGDYHTHVAEFSVRDIEPVGELLNGWSQAGRLVVLPSENQSVIGAMMLDPIRPAVVTSETGEDLGSRLAGNLVLAPPLLRVWSAVESNVRSAHEELVARLGMAVEDQGMKVLPMSTYGDILSEAIVFPPRGLDQEVARQRVLDSARKHFEEVWIHRPLRSLAGNTPVDAAGHPVLKKKLLGAIQFIQECSAVGVIRDYDFNRLRAKLGLTPTAGTPDPAASAGTDISGMSAAELTALSPESLDDEQLEKAFQTAQKLDASEVAGHFGEALFARPPGGGNPDRWPVFTFLYQRALGESDHDAALDLLNEGERQDCENNEGRRRNDYELRRAQLLVRRREAGEAQDVFSRLIDRVPDNLRFRSSAAEGMLSLNQPQKAISFAEAGILEARRQNDRDAEGHMQELLENAKKRAQGS